MSTKHPVERGGEGRGGFEHLAERVSNLTSSPLFFSGCCLLVLTWVLSYALHWPDGWRSFLGDLLSALTLTLVALLKNTERRSEHAVQRKLDAIARALAEMSRASNDQSAEELEQAIGVHEDI